MQKSDTSPRTRSSAAHMSCRTSLLQSADVPPPNNFVAEALAAHRQSLADKHSKPEAGNEMGKSR
jgi:hypothetical protein